MMTENSECLPRQENMWLKLEKIVIPMKEMDSEHRAGPLDMVTVSGLVMNLSARIEALKDLAHIAQASTVVE